MVKGKPVIWKVPEPLPQTENKTSKTDFNIFEFLDEAMEKSSVELDNSLTTDSVKQSEDIPIISSPSKQSIQPNHVEVDDLNSINKKNSNSAHNIKDKHLEHLQSRITTKQISSHSEQKLLTLQQKLKNKPTKLAIVMKAIFDPPKSQGI